MRLSKTMTKELEEARLESRAKIPAKALELIDRSTAALVSGGARSSALKRGQTAEDFILMDTHGQPVRLQALLNFGPVVLSFYRGGWCPYCRIELQGLQRALPAIKALGGAVLAVSPQLPEKSLSTVVKNEVMFPVLSDVGNIVARRFGIVYRLSRELLSVHDKADHSLSTFNGDTGSQELPMAATFVLDQSRVVRLAFVDEDYTRRLDPERIIEVLQSLARRKWRKK